MKKLLLLSFLSITILAARSQSKDCKVSLDSLKGTYTGDCKNGKADGKGVATGTDTYDGDFKNGLPDGLGKYTWKNGNYYYGEWKKGVKEGKGEMHEIEKGTEKLVKGYWKKDRYIGQNLKPFVIRDASSGIGRVEVTKIDTRGNSITIELQGMSGGQNVMLGRTESAGQKVENVPVATTTNITLTSITIRAGNYNTKSTNMLTNKEITTLRNIIFPFRANLVIGQNSVDIELLEEGDWQITIPITR